MKRSTTWLTIFALAGGMAFARVSAAEFGPEPVADDRGTDKLDRTVLPIPEPRLPPITTLDARNAKAPARFEVKAPTQAPNVLIVLIDDMGFGQASAFGGPIHMPTLERLARGGLRYNQFHTTALCSPTRAALLTGRNHHVCNMGSIPTARSPEAGPGGPIVEEAPAETTEDPSNEHHRLLVYDENSGATS